MRTVLDHHVTAALFTDHICYFIFNLNFLKLLLCNLNSFFKIRIEITDYFLPRNFSFFNHIQKAFHVRCKMNIYNTWERLLHNIINNFTNLCQIKVLTFFCNISSSKDQRNGWSIGTWTSDSKLFHCLYKARLCIMCRRLCKMLLWIKFFFCKNRIHTEMSDQYIALFLLFLCLYIHGAESIKCNPCC